MEYDDEIIARMHNVTEKRIEEFELKLEGCTTENEMKDLLNRYEKEIEKNRERATLIWQGKKPGILVEVIDVYQDIFNKNG